MVEEGDRRFRVWLGPFSGTVWAGKMRFDGERWEAMGQKYDVTDDVVSLFASREARDLIAGQSHPEETA